MAKYYGKYFLALLLFGSNGVVSSRIPLNSYEIVFWRTLIGSAFLLGLLGLTRARAWRRPEGRHLLFVALSGGAMGASWICLFEAYATVGVSVATLAYYCGPVIVMALSPLLFGERMTLAKALGFGAVLLGMFWVNGAALAGGAAPLGLVCGALSALLYAAMVIFNKKAKSITGLQNAALQLLAGFLTVAVYTLARGGAALPAQMGELAPLLFLGLVNTGLGCYLYFSAIGRLPAGTVAICGYLEPLSALGFAALLLGEALSPLQLAGAALILGGAAAGELLGRPGRWGIKKAPGGR